MDIRKEFENLQYFFDSYYNQTFYDAKLEDKFLELLNDEPKWVSKALKWRTVPGTVRPLMCNSFLYECRWQEYQRICRNIELHTI